VRVGSGDSPLDILEALSAARHEAEVLFRLAAPGDNTVEGQLANGNFVGVANAMVIQPVAAVRVLMLVAPEFPPLARPGTALPAAQSPDVLPRLSLPAQVAIGQAIEAVLDWGGNTPPAASPQWRCEPQDAADISPSERGARITPKVAGFLSVSAKVAETAAATSSTYVGEVTATATYSQIASDAARVNGYIATATAALTIFAGYEIFIGTWIGTFGDFFAAFIWGFFGQFGLDRVRDLAKPITSRSLSM
jgi:hypothetical protein